MYKKINYFPFSHFIFILIIIMILGCGTMREKGFFGTDINQVEALITMLDSLELKLEMASVHMGEANWNIYTGEGPADLDSVKKEFAEILLNEEYQKTVDTWQGRIGTQDNPLLARRLELWHRCFLGATVDNNPEIYSLENKLEKIIADFSYRLNSEAISRAQISQILRLEDDPGKRHRAWVVPAQLSWEVEEDLLRLRAMSNQKAGALGSPNYPRLCLSLQGVDRKWLEELMAGLEEKTRRPYQTLLDSLKRQWEVETLHPWDMDYLLHKTASLPDSYFTTQEALPILTRFLNAIGFPIETLPIRVVFKDIPYGGLNLAVRIPEDDRLLVGPVQGHRFYGILFHEYGHGLQAVYTRVKPPILKGYEWLLGNTSPGYSEGLADIIADYTQDPLWLTTYTQVPDSLISVYQRAKIQSKIYGLRSLLATITFELEAYGNLGADLDSLHKAFIRQFLFLEISEDEPASWAANTLLTTYPVYFQNYLLSSLISAQVHETMVAKFGEGVVDSVGVGQWLVKNLYEAGETEEWTRRIEKATGRPLGSSAYLRSLKLE